MEQKDDTRRSFLKQILVGSTLAAGSTLTLKKAQASKEKEVERPEEICYRRTEEFEKYYNSLR
ncbi:MAG: hypothetical protein ABFS19_04880 [Thermodesulfobacteriota bacterium]